MTSQADTETEAAALREGEYVAVRRFTRLLEGGPEAKAALDQVPSSLSRPVLRRLSRNVLLRAHPCHVCMQISRSLAPSVSSKWTVNPAPALNGAPSCSRACAGR